MSKKNIFIPALLARMFAKNNELTEETAEDGYVFDNGKHCAVYRERGPVNVTMKEHANVYNPISFLEDDMDVITFVRCLMDIQLDGETDFLRKAKEEIFLSACVHYLMQYKEDADIHMLYDMIPAVENEGDYLVDDDALTKTTQLFSVLDETSSARGITKHFCRPPD